MTTYLWTNKKPKKVENLWWADCCLCKKYATMKYTLKSFKSAQKRVYLHLCTDCYRQSFFETLNLHVGLCVLCLQPAIIEFSSLIIREDQPNAPIFQKRACGPGCLKKIQDTDLFLTDVALCYVCKKDGASVTCSKCDLFHYCSKECQKKDLPSHQLLCKTKEETK